jgi:L-malate glycosyltransferase
MKKKIVFVGSHLSFQRGTKGMSEKISELLRQEYDITLVSSQENIILRLLDIIWILFIKRFYMVHIDVFSNRGFYYADIASRIARLKNETVVMTLRGGMLAEKYERESDRVQRVLSRADVLQSPSLFLISFFNKQGIKVQYLPNFIDLKYFPYGRKNVQPYSILWVRAFSSEYHPELAIQTVRKLLKKYPETTLTMIGPDKGVLNQTKQLVHELGIESKVTFEGNIANEQLFRYFQSCSVYLNTTEYESFGVAVLEAAACGIPIVSTRIGEIPYIWKENKEMLMTELNSDDMTEKVSYIFNTPKMCENFSINARKKAVTFEWSKIKLLWVETINSLQDLK